MADKGQCSRIEIELAENGGFSVRKFYKAEPAKGDSSGRCAPIGYIEPKTYAFSTLDDLSTFLHETLGDSKRGRLVRKQG